MTLPHDPRRVFWGSFAAILLVQAAWILAVPAFRGSDEFDHVYKAAAVARGQWTAREPAPHGRGGIVTIPRDIVAAASSVCDSYHYTGHDNCFPIQPTRARDVQVATAANAYNPAYYVVTGWLSKPFHGAGVDYVMRIVTAVGCALLMSWAAAVTARWATTSWPFLALAVGFTPVMLYSTAIAAPNGLTYASAALVWSVLMALGRRDVDQRGLAAAITVACTALVATHTTGVMWLALILGVAIVLRPAREWMPVVRTHWRSWLVTVVVVGATTGLCLAWIRFAATNSLGEAPPEHMAFPWGDLPLYHLRWAFQSIGAFPLRNDPAPAPVYAIYGLVLLGVLLALVRFARLRERTAVLATILALVIVPTVLTLMSYQSEGIAWQGRYSLPMWLGITAVAGVVLDRQGQPARRLVLAWFILLAAGMELSVLHVGLREASSGPSDPLASALPGGFVLTGALALGGLLLPLLVLGRRDVGRRGRDAGAQTASAMA